MWDAQYVGEWTEIKSGPRIHGSISIPIVYYYEIAEHVFWTENNPNSIYLKRKFTSLFKQSLNLHKALVIIVEPEVH